MKSVALNLFLSISVVLVLSVVSVSSVSADLYYECKAGYTLQSKGKAVRCHKAGGLETKPPKRCGKEYISAIKRKINLLIKVDFARKEDKCVGVYKENNKSKKVVKKVVCPSGYKKEIKAQKDLCKKMGAAKNLPPLKGVNK